MADLRCQLEQAKQELDSRETANSTKGLVDCCAALERKLYDKDRQLPEAQTTDSDPLLWTRLANIGQERDQDNDQVRELFSEGQTLEARYNELKQQMAT